RVTVAIVAARDDVEQGGRVTYRASDGSGVADVLPAGKARVLGNATVGRLEAEQVTERRRDAHGAAAVRAEGERAQPARHRGRRAPAGAARGELDIPRIAGGAEERIVRQRLV